jgi:hypothetical protein
MDICLCNTKHQQYACLYYEKPKCGSIKFAPPLEFQGIEYLRGLSRHVVKLKFIYLWLGLCAP